MSAVAAPPQPARIPRVVPVLALSIFARSATNTSAFNVGNSLGPALGRPAIGAGWGFTAPAYLGVLPAAGAIGVALVSWRPDRRGPLHAE